MQRLLYRAVWSVLFCCRRYRPHRDLHSFPTRRSSDLTPVTVEGWALYCEDMMGEEGFYRSEEEQFFQRVHLLWRAVRVLLDVGLHTRGMTFAQAVDYLATHVNVERANAEGEARGECAGPGEPPACG